MAISRYLKIAYDLLWYAESAQDLQIVTGVHDMDESGGPADVVSNRPTVIWQHPRRHINHDLKNFSVFLCSEVEDAATFIGHQNLIVGLQVAERVAHLLRRLSKYF
jgi:hypothetical protein